MTLLIQTWILTIWICNCMQLEHPFFLALKLGTYPSIDTGGCSVQQLALHHKI